MKGFIFLAILASSSVAMAGELDRGTSVITSMTPQQMAAAKGLPKTTVIRINRETKQVEVAFSETRLPKGVLNKNLTFEQVAMNSEKTGIAYGSRELDKTQTSTPSWFMGFRGGGGRGWGGGGIGWGGNVGWGGGWYNGAVWGPRYYNIVGPAYYYPTYAYGGIDYNCAPYWTGYDEGYDYAYSSWY